MQRASWIVTRHMKLSPALPHHIEFYGSHEHCTLSDGMVVVVVGMVSGVGVRINFGGAKVQETASSVFISLLSIV